MAGHAVGRGAFFLDSDHGGGCRSVVGEVGIGIGGGLVCVHFGSKHAHGTRIHTTHNTDNDTPRSHKQT